MTDLEELIETAQRLSNRLEQAAQDELRFSYDLCHKLEMLSWETFKTANDLKCIKEYL